MKHTALSFPQLAVTLLAASYVAQGATAPLHAVKRILECPVPSTVTLTPATHTVFPSAVTRTITVSKTVDLLKTLTQTISLEPSTVTVTVVDTVTQCPATTTITLTVTSLQTSTTASKSTTVGPTASSTPALSGFFFSPYKDTSINLDWNTNVVTTDISGSPIPVFSQATSDGLTALTFGYATGECGSENWGGVDGAAFAEANLAFWSRPGQKFMLSTGGSAGIFTCGSDTGMETFISRWASSQLEGVDFSIEGGQTPSVINDLVERVKVSQSAHPNLRFSFTLATLGCNTTQGSNLNTLGDDTMNAIQNAGLTDYYINLLAMDYGAASSGVCVVADDSCDMAASAIAAARSLHTLRNVSYNQIELTVMIGGNDVADEFFTLQNVDTVVSFVRQSGLGGLHFWSFDRDVDCPKGSASAICNSMGNGYAGVAGFTKRFLTDGI